MKMGDENTKDVLRKDFETLIGVGKILSVVVAVIGVIFGVIEIAAMHPNVRSYTVLLASVVWLVFMYIDTVKSRAKRAMK